MKYCDYCGTKNGKKELFCLGCGRPLKKNARQESQEIAAREAALKAKKEHRWRIAGYCLGGGMYLAYFVLYILLCTRGRGDIGWLLAALFFPGIGYLWFNHPEIMIFLRHIAVLQSSDDVILHKWDDWIARITALLFWGMGLFSMVQVYLSPRP